MYTFYALPCNSSLFNVTPVHLVIYMGSCCITTLWYLYLSSSDFLYFYQVRKIQFSILTHHQYVPFIFSSIVIWCQPFRCSQWKCNVNLREKPCFQPERSTGRSCVKRLLKADTACSRPGLLSKNWTLPPWRALLFEQIWNSSPLQRSSENARAVFLCPWKRNKCDKTHKYKQEALTCLDSLGMTLFTQQSVVVTI